MSIRLFGFSIAALAALPAISSAAIIYSPVVTVLGDGATTLGSAGFRTTIASYYPSLAGQATPVSSIAYANGASGPRLVNSGSSTSEGSLTNNPALANAAAQGLSYSNPGYAYSAGYDAAAGTATIITTATNAPRAIGRVSLNDWTVTSPTVLQTQTQATAYNNNNFRGATGSDAASNPAIYSAGTGGTSSTAGWRNFATNTILSAAPTNVRTVELLGSSLFGSTGAGTTGIYLLDPAGITAASLFIATTASPYEFALFNDPANTSSTQGFNVAYVADDGSATTTGGIQKYTYNGTAWSLAYILRDTATSYRGLAGQLDAATGLYTLFASSADGKKLQQVTDTGAASTFTTLATVDGTTSAFRGVALTIPTPGTASLLGLGGLLAIRRRR